MRQMLTVMAALLIGVTANFGQTPLFTEDFESGTPSTDWALYRADEEMIQAVAMASAPAPLANGGSYVGLVHDADASYSGSGIALAGTVDDSNYTVEADVYVYTNHPGGSAYTGIIAYADSSKGVYVKLAADFDADMRFRLYNNKLDFVTFQYTFHHSIDASNVDTSEGWHHMKVKVQTLPDGTTAYTCYYDHELIGNGAYVDTSAHRLASGQWGLWAFQQDADGIEGYFDNMSVTPNHPDLLFTEDFESGTPSTDWALYRADEEMIQAVAMASAPEALANGGSYVGLVHDADASYNGSGIALAGTVDDSNYTIEGDVYVYTNHPGGSAYTGLIAYADSAKGVYVKLAADFDSDNRFRLYNNRLDMVTYQYTFHYSIDASNVDTTEGWHHMKVEVETQPDGTTAYTCYYDGALIGDGAYIDTSAHRLSSGQYGAYAFQMDADGIAGYFDNIEVYGHSATPVAIKSRPEPAAGLPAVFALSQNYPNPFNPSTSIDVQLYTASRINLAVYDLNGKVIRTLVDNYFAPSSYTFVWDGRDMMGKIMPSGVYFYRLTNGIQHDVKRMILLK